jgi:5'-nucleotidase
MKRKTFNETTGWIQTFKRKRFYPLTPRVEDIDIEDIAHGLSGEGRFTNQTEESYYVAQHSVMVAWLLAAWGEPIIVQLQGLLHDADEAYIPDLARPVKHQLRMGVYRVAGKRILRAVFRKYNLPLEELPIVKRADEFMLSLEAQQLFQGGPLPGWWRKLKKVRSRIKLVPWDRATAKRIFLNEFQYLINEVGQAQSAKRARLARQRGKKLLTTAVRPAVEV